MSESTQTKTVTDTNESKNEKRKYKDTVFYDLFKDTANFIEMYNAISGNSIDKKTANIEEVTISNAVYSNLKNDIGMKIDNKLVVLIEQQSTWNNNMPLRFLGYLIATFKQQLEKNTIYSSKLIKIAMPEFYVIYNGPIKKNAEVTLKLSDSYDDIEKARVNGEYPLEILVKVININHENNKRILKNSKTLLGYQKLVSKVYELKNEGIDTNSAISIAVKWCIEKGYLDNYLSKQKGVFDMLSDEYNEIEHLKVVRKEGLEDGIEIGEARGLAKGEAIGREKQVEELYELYPKVLDMINDKKSDREIMDELDIDIKELELYKRLVTMPKSK